MTATIQTEQLCDSLVSPMAGGTYNWRVRDDIVCADAVVAALFGIPAKDAEDGLPIGRFLDSIHPEDRERVCCSINAAVDSGHVFREKYRVISASGTVTPILAMGQCFRDKDGQPLEYSGMLFDLRAAEIQRRRDDEMTDSCIAAFHAAKKAGHELITYLLSMALIEIGQNAVLDIKPEKGLH